MISVYCCVTGRQGTDLVAAKRARQQERKKSLPGQRTPLPRAVPKENLILTPGTYSVTVAPADIHTASQSPVTVTSRADKLFDQIDLDQNGFIRTARLASSELAAVRLAEAAERAKARFMKEDAEAAGLSLSDIDQPLSLPAARPSVQQRTEPAAAYTRIDSNEVSCAVPQYASPPVSHSVSHSAWLCLYTMPDCPQLCLPLVPECALHCASPLCLTMSLQEPLASLNGDMDVDPELYKEALELFDLIDANGNGEISLSEWHEFQHTDLVSSLENTITSPAGSSLLTSLFSSHSAHGALSRFISLHLWVALSLSLSLCPLDACLYLFLRSTLLRRAALPLLVSPASRQDNFDQMDTNGDGVIDRQEWDVAHCQSESDEDYPPGLEPPSVHSSRAEGSGEGSGQTEMSLEVKVEAAIDRRFDEVCAA